MKVLRLLRSVKSININRLANNTAQLKRNKARLLNCLNSSKFAGVDHYNALRLTAGQFSASKFRLVPSLFRKTRQRNSCSASDFLC